LDQEADANGDWRQPNGRHREGAAGKEEWRRREAGAGAIDGSRKMITHNRNKDVVHAVCVKVPPACDPFCESASVFVARTSNQIRNDRRQRRFSEVFLLAALSRILVNRGDGQLNSVRNRS
jgi:hypothetical protein